jgi:hypothetical protein
LVWDAVDADALLTNSADADDEVVWAGEKDPHRLTVCGLTYLRELDGTTDPVKAGFTGL